MKLAKKNSSIFLCSHGEPTAHEFGCALPEENFITTVKYPGEARGCFGVALRRKEVGTIEGLRLNPFNYTGQKVVGVKTFQNLQKVEREKVKLSNDCWEEKKTREQTSIWV